MAGRELEVVTYAALAAAGAFAFQLTVDAAVDLIIWLGRALGVA